MKNYNITVTQEELDILILSIETSEAYYGLEMDDIEEEYYKRSRAVSQGMLQKLKGVDAGAAWAPYKVPCKEELSAALYQAREESHALSLQFEEMCEAGIPFEGSRVAEQTQFVRGKMSALGYALGYQTLNTGGSDADQ
jgi:hypothetical protein